MKPKVVSINELVNQRADKKRSALHHKLWQAAASVAMDDPDTVALGVVLMTMHVGHQHCKYTTALALPFGTVIILDLKDRKRKMTKDDAKKELLASLRGTIRTLASELKRVQR